MVIDGLDTPLARGQANFVVCDPSDSSEPLSCAWPVGPLVGVSVFFSHLLSVNVPCFIALDPQKWQWRDATLVARTRSKD